MKTRNFLAICAVAAVVPLAAQAQPNAPLTPKGLAALKACEGSSAPAGPAVKRLLAAEGTPAGGVPTEATADTQTHKGLIALAKLKARGAAEPAPAMPVFLARACLREEGATPGDMPPRALAEYLRTH